MRAFIVTILILVPAMLYSAGMERPGASILNTGQSILIADSNKSADSNDNITIVLPADEDIDDESGESGEKSAEDQDTWKFGFELESNFNTKDWMLGCGLGLQHLSGISLLLRFQIRPLTNAIFEEQTSNVYRQYNERRMVLGLSAGWDYMILQPFGIYINAGYGVSFAYFRGSGENPETVWTPMAGGGVLIAPWEVTSFRVGYEYIRTPQYPDHHINISAALMF